VTGAKAHRILLAGIGLALASCDLMFPPPSDGAPTINIYADRYEFRLGRYETTRALRIALEASTEVPVAVEVHDCEARERLEPVLDLVRARGQYNLSIIMPDDC
jgi:hypothetical protein